MTTFFKVCLGLGSIILGGWVLSYAINQSQAELDPVDLVSNFDNEYYDNEI